MSLLISFKNKAWWLTLSNALLLHIVLLRSASMN